MGKLRPDRTWLVGLGLWAVLGCFQPVHAQNLETRLELRFSTAIAISNLPPSASWGLGAQLEARYDLNPWRFRLVLNPGVSFSRTPNTDAGLSELYLLYRENELDVSAGLERLPLEVARLSLPYSLEAVSPLGNRLGRWGARVSWNPEATRLRLALLEDASQLLPVLSLRREFGDFELEAHALYPTRWVLGLGGSGTVAGLVVYGEGWLLLNPLEARYALGLSGSLGEGVWTLEGGYATTLPLLPASHFLAGQWIIPQGEEASWSLTAYLLLSNPWQFQLGSGYRYNLAEHELNASLATHFSSQSWRLLLTLSIRAFQ